MADPNAGDEDKPVSEQTDDDILAEARKNRKACCDADGTNRIDKIADLKFLKGGANQWDPVAAAAREVDRRPMITVNTLPTYLHQVTNDQRMNTPAIKVHPVDDKADVETAKLRQGLIRHIEYDSNADTAYDTAVNSAAAVGDGYWRLITEYEDRSWFNKRQKIKFQRIRNVLSVRTDPLAVEADGSDMRYAFVELKMPKETFKREYPKAEACTTSIFNDDSTYADWLTDTEVLVCDYYRIETTEEDVIRLSNGDEGFKKDLIDMDPGVTIVEEAKGERRKVMLYKITGVDVLERTEIKCKWIPVFPVYGDELDIEGEVTRSGIIRHAKGPAQMYNVMMTSAVEEVSLRAKSPYIMAEGQDEGWEDEWDEANTRARSVLHYKLVALDGKLAPPPQRNPMADVPAGMLAMAMHASDNVKKTTGLFDASLGAKGTATSGVQEKAQQREGDVANFHYADSLLRTIVHCGRCLNWMIPHYYDTERQVRILGEDGQATHTTINKKLPDGTVENDMTVGEFDITVTAGPSFTTMRQENAEFFAKALAGAKDPASAAVFGYLSISNQDVPNGELAAKMMATTLPPAAKAVLDEEKGGDEEGEGEVIQTPHGPLPIARVPQILQQMEAQIAQLTEVVQKADAAKKQLDVMKQQQVMNEQQLEPERQRTEQMKIAADIKKAEAAGMAAQADLLRAQAEAEAIPHKARTEALMAETAHMEAQVKALSDQRQQEIDAAVASSEALNGDTTAFDAWKATLEAQTKIRVAEIMADSRERTAALKPKPTEKAH